MLHNIVRFHNGKATLVLGDTNIPVQIDTLNTSIDSSPRFECHVNGPMFGGTRTNYAKCYSGTTDKFAIKNVIFNDPATIVLWADGTKTVVKCQEGDEYSEEVGLALCFAKKALGNKSNFNNVFKKWIPEEQPDIQFDASALFGNPSSVAQDVMKKFKDALNHQRGIAVDEV